MTDRRAAERGLAALLQQSETLLQEMQYHVASSLQIIAGILFLKVRTVQSEETRLHLRDLSQCCSPTAQNLCATVGAFAQGLHRSSVGPRPRLLWPNGIP